MSIPQDIHASIQAQTGLVISSASPVSGGCIHHGNKIDTNDGPFFLKYNHAREADNFQAESKGLALLGESGAVSTPNVMAQGESDQHAWLLMTWIEPGRRTADFEQHLGRQLAYLHRNSTPQFGLDHDNFIGRLPQPNAHRDSWTAFFLEQRIFPMMHMARNQGYLSQQEVRQMEALTNVVDHVCPEAHPALLHGDLWGGNLLVNPSGMPVLIDPAVYYGHPEMELAFMTMFDSYSKRFYEAYESVNPLSPGYRDRFDLYNLYPLLVHVNLFGVSYLGGVRQVLNRYVG